MSNVFECLFKKRTLKVRVETNLLTVLTMLGSVGVMIDGRCTIEATDDGTIIEFLATEMQWKMIDELLKHYNELEKELEEKGLNETLFKD